MARRKKNDELRNLTLGILAGLGTGAGALLLWHLYDRMQHNRKLNEYEKTLRSARLANYRAFLVLHSPDPYSDLVKVAIR